MAVLSGIVEGWQLLKDSFRVLAKEPVFLIPIFFAWIVFASIILYMRYCFEAPSSIPLAVLYIYILLFLITLVVCLANIVMLEFMQQIESGENISFARALKEAVILDLVKVMPIAAIWAVVWLVILILKGMTSKESGGKAKPSARDAARALGGAGTPFSFLRLGLDMIEKLVRMGMFLALPGIAWDDKGPFAALCQSIRIIKKHPVQFLTAYTLTLVAALIMVLPLLPIFWLDDLGVAFPPVFWTGVIIYESIIWTLGIYLEQMSVGLLYLWHLKWVKNGSTGELSSVPRPDLLDNVYELK